MITNMQNCCSKHIGQGSHLSTKTMKIIAGIAKPQTIVLKGNIKLLNFFIIMK